MPLLDLSSWEKVSRLKPENACCPFLRSSQLVIIAVLPTWCWCGKLATLKKGYTAYETLTQTLTNWTSVVCAALFIIEFPKWAYVKNLILFHLYKLLSCTLELFFHERKVRTMKIFCPSRPLLCKSHEGVKRLSTLFQSLFPKLAFIQADKKRHPPSFFQRIMSYMTTCRLLLCCVRFLSTNGYQASIEIFLKTIGDRRGMR